MRTKYVGWQLRMTTILRDRACRRCGKPVAYTTGANVKGNACWRAYDAQGGSFHFDHIQPISRGGKSITDNIQLLCAKCNLSKGNST